MWYISGIFIRVCVHACTWTSVHAHVWVLHLMGLVQRNLVVKKPVLGLPWWRSG